MPKLACRSCGRQIYTVAPIEALFSEERRCPRCGALMDRDRRDGERRTGARRVTPPVGSAPSGGERRTIERRVAERRQLDRDRWRPRGA